MRHRTTQGDGSLFGARYCDRCPEVKLELQPFYEGSEKQCLYCPCCRSKLRTVEMLQAEADADAESLGMTRDEYEAHMDAQAALIVRKPTERDMEAAQVFAKQWAEEWTPVCPHETKNPWL